MEEMVTQLDSSSEMFAKIRFIDSLYLYSDLSVAHIAKTLKMDEGQVQKIIGALIRKDALEAIYEQSNIPVRQIMRKDVAVLDASKSAHDAIMMMIKKGVGCVVVIDKGKPFGMVTERDIICEMAVFDKNLADLSLGVIASRPLIQVSPLETVRYAVDLMVENSIRRIPVVQGGEIIGMVVTKDIAILLSSMKRPGLSKAILEAISRSRTG